MNRTARLLMQHYGARVDFPDGTSHYLFPTPETLANCAVTQLRSKTSIGYRAKPVVEVSRMVCKDELRLDELAKFPYEEAFDIVLELPGVGPKVADCFLLYGLGKKEAAPVDVWIHRIVSKLYFKRKKITRLVAARFLRERFKGWAGYAQLYLFDYARRGVANHQTKQDGVQSCLEYLVLVDSLRRGFRFNLVPQTWQTSRSPAPGYRLKHAGQ